jgi:predicted Ser/Thr protein kinase
MAEHIGPYEILGKLGSGGMGTVYRARVAESGSRIASGDARDLGVGALVALKVLKEEVAEDPELARRFEQEANTLRKLDHENIVRLLEYGADGDAYYIAMELVEGESLQQRLRREGRLPEAEVRRIGIAVAAALEAAHGQRIIHRDIKPGNILLGTDGSVKVSDFGVARVLDETRRTRTGTFLGSLAYAAPEAFDRPADERSDLYSLGIVLYECVMGVVPFRADAPLRMLELQRWGAPDLSAMPSEPELSAIIEHLLEKQPHRRPESAAAVLTRLREAGSGELDATLVASATHDDDTVRAASSSSIDPTSRLESSGRRMTLDLPLRVVVGAGVGLILAVGVAGGAWALARGGGGEPPPRAIASPIAKRTPPAAQTASADKTRTAAFLAAAATKDAAPTQTPIPPTTTPVPVAPTPEPPTAVPPPPAPTPVSGPAAPVDRPPNGSIGLVAQASGIRCDGSEKSTVTALVSDSDGNYVADGTPIRFVSAGASVSPINTVTRDGIATTVVTPLSPGPYFYVTVEAIGGSSSIRIDCG